MTDYKNIFGKPVKFLTTDPDNEQAEGQIWYNSTDGAFKDVIASTAWSSASNMITSRRLLAGAGTQTAGLAFGGYPPTSSSNETEEYNGSGWSSGGNMGTARYRLAGAGLQTAGLAFGGEASGTKQNATEEYTGAFNSTRTLTTS